MEVRRPKRRGSERKALVVHHFSWGQEHVKQLGASCPCTCPRGCDLGSSLSQAQQCFILLPSLLLLLSPSPEPKAEIHLGQNQIKRGSWFRGLATHVCAMGLAMSWAIAEFWELVLHPGLSLGSFLFLI